MHSDATTDLGSFPEFANAIKALGPTGPSDDELAQFVVHDSEKLQIVYAPFDWINPQPAIVVSTLAVASNIRSCTTALANAATAEMQMAAVSLVAMPDMVSLAPVGNSKNQFLRIF